MKRTKETLKFQKFGVYRDNKMMRRLKIGGQITNYQGYGQESRGGCICCNGIISVKNGRKHRKNTIIDRINRKFKRKARRLAKQEIYNEISSEL